MKRYAAGILALTLVLGGGAFSGISPLYEVSSFIEVSAEEQTENQAESVILTGSWEGTYTGHNGSTKIERKIKLNIFKQEEGRFVGSATIDEGENGSYYLKGTIDTESGDLFFKGEEWILNPSNFSFGEFKGKIDENGDFTGTVDGSDDKPFTLKKTSDEFTDSSISLENIPTDWIGEYDGKHNSATVRRNYEFHIKEVNEDGSFNGIAVLSPSDKAEAKYGASGSYNFKGNIDTETGHIHMQGNEWIDYPIGYDNFDFIELYGTLSPEDGTIKGGTERGIWDMQVIDFTKVKTASSFTLGKDNNSFSHSNSKKDISGFEGYDNYYINDEYYKKLTNSLEKGEKDRIDATINSKWGGSCYGIATTMGLAFEGKIDIDDINSNSAESYYLMSYPKNDDKLISSINYYQLTQLLDRCSKDKISISNTYGGTIFNDLKNWSADNDSLSIFLKTLVRSCNNDHVNMLCMGYKNGFLSTGGHSILVTGSRFDEAAQEYVVELYDENSVGEEEAKGKFTEMRIKKDYSDFKLYEPNGDVIDKSNYRSFALIDWEKMHDVILDEKPADDGRTTLTIKFSDLIRIESENGKYIEYDGESFKGDMNIYGVDDLTGENDPNGCISFITDNSDNFFITKANGSVDLEVSSAKGYMSIEGTGITGAELSEANGIKVEGKNIDFDAALSNYGENSRAANVIKVSGKSEGNFDINRDENKDITVKADKPIKDGTLTYIRDTKTKNVKLDDTATAKINSELPVGSLTGDADLDDNINVKDIALMASHIKGIKPLSQEQFAAADTDHNSNINVKDIAMVASHIKGIKALK